MKRFMILRGFSRHLRSRAFRFPRPMVELLEDRCLLATFTVNSTLDLADPNTGDGRCDALLGDIFPGDQCTLRAAIQQANASAGADVIDFDIASGHQTIALATPLPAIIDPVTIDGTTQPANSGPLSLPCILVSGHPCIELNGAGAGLGAGIRIISGSSTVRGLVINRFHGNAIELVGGGSNAVERNFIGTDETGFENLGNAGSGVFVSSPLNRIGGVGTASNVIASNDTGVRLDGIGAGGNTIVGNRIGTNADGSRALGNDFGVFLSSGANGNVIGGTAADEGNLISGNRIAGVWIEGASNALRSFNNRLLGNLIGVDAAATFSIANGTGSISADRGGVIIKGTGPNSVGGTSAGARNVISGNAGVGVGIAAAAFSYSGPGNLVEGNRIGTDGDGKSALGNSTAGIEILGMSNNTIQENLISANGEDGVRILNGGSTGNVVQGNRIGTDAAGAISLGNAEAGVLISDAAGNIVGGTTTGAGNVISGNIQDGIRLKSSLLGNVVQGNLVGTNATGVRPLANGFGIHILGPNNLIGGTSAAERNLVSGNQNDGIFIDGAGAAGNQVTGNFIGTTVDGSSALGNGGDGVSIDGAVNNHIGGTEHGAGNVIAGNLHGGITINGSGASSNQIEGNFVGTDRTGTAAVGNADGILINAGASGNRVGGTIPAARNIISGNQENGVRILGRENLVEGNFVGTDITGAETPQGPMQRTGVRIDGADNIIGGTAAGAGNLISGNFAALAILAKSGTGNIVQGNLIGTDATGTANLLSFPISRGVVVSGPANEIGGTTAGARNVISGNVDGVVIDGAAASGNVVEGNFIGTDITGTLGLGNFFDGVLIHGAPNNTVGGVTDASRNIVSANGAWGLEITDGTADTADVAIGNVVQGNFIGTDATGTASLGNSAAGVRIVSAFVTIGDSGSGNVISDNVISGNHQSGIELSSSGSRVQGNFIGTDVKGTRSLGNARHGVLVNGSDNTIGGPDRDAGNLIAFNGEDGVAVENLTADGNVISSNRIHTNDALGIDLGTGSPDVTPNDAGDSDEGPNRLQNFPTLDAVVLRGNSTVIAGTLSSRPNITYRIEFFASTVADPSGNGEGEQYLGSTIVTTHSSTLAFVGIANFEVTIPSVPVGQFLTATTTDPDGNTSEFSPAVAVIADTQAPTWPAGSTLDAIHICDNALTLNWTAAQDNVFVDGYKIFKNGSLLANTGPNDRTMDVTGLVPGVAYTFKVEATDLSGNVSTTGPSVTVNIGQVPESLNLTVRKIEVTQAIQFLDDPDHLDNGLPLVKNKPLAVRVYIDASGTNQCVKGVSVRLSTKQLGAADSDFATQVPYNGWETTTVKPWLTPQEQRAGHDSNITFLVDPHALESGDVDFRAEVNPPIQASPLDRTTHAIHEANYNDNTLLPIPHFAFVPTHPLDVKFVKIVYQPDFTKSAKTGSFAAIDVMLSYVRQVYPVEDIHYSRASTKVYVNPLTTSPVALAAGFPTLWFTILSQLAVMRTANGDADSNTIYYGLLDPDVFKGGMGWPEMFSATRVAGGPSDADGGGETLAHEIGHVLNRFHAPCGLPGSPANFPVDDNWPEATNPRTIIGQIGFNVLTGEVLLANDHNASDDENRIDEDEYKDFMSYCFPQWVSPYTYRHLYNDEFSEGNPSPPPGGTPADYLVISGQINEDGSMMLGDFLHNFLPTGTSDQIGAGDYSIVLRAADGLPLFTRQFNPLTHESDDFGGIFEIVPYFADTARIDIMHGGEMMATRPVTVNPPSIHFSSSPSGVFSEPAALGWGGFDPDGDALSFDLQYSRDDGTTWQTLATGLHATSLDIDPADLGGTQSGRIRIIASDGVNVAQDDAAPTFVVAGKLPQVAIVSPPPVTSMPAGTALLLEATGSDLEDGVLPNSSLHWSSDRDGLLGTGQFVVAKLSPGVHSITVTGHDSDGNVARDTISVISVADTTPPTWPAESILGISEVGPASLALTWPQVDSGEGVVRYNIYRDGTLLDIVDGTEIRYVAVGLTSGTQYIFKVEACDAAENCTTDGPSRTVVKADSTPPTIEDLATVPGAKSITQVRLMLSEDLDRSTAEDLNSYRLLFVGKDNRAGTRDDRVVTIRSVLYTPASHSVTITPTKALKLNQFFQITVDGTNRVTDVAGNHLDGDEDGTPGGNFVRTFGLGQKLSYTDGDGDTVSLRLTGGGLMELIRSSNGEGDALRLFGRHAATSVLSGSLRAAASGSDRVTHLQSITGVTGVANRLTNPPFITGNISAAVVDRLLEPLSRDGLLAEFER